MSIEKAKECIREVLEVYLAILDAAPELDEQPIAKKAISACRDQATHALAELEQPEPSEFRRYVKDELQALRPAKQQYKRAYDLLIEALEHNDAQAAENKAKDEQNTKLKEACETAYATFVLRVMNRESELLAVNKLKEALGEKDKKNGNVPT